MPGGACSLFVLEVDTRQNRRPPHDHLLSRAAIALRQLEEIGEPYQLHPLSFKKGETRQAAYLAINPMGKVPAIDHDGVIVTEAAAICCHLADAFPKAGLGVPVGDRRRGPYL